MSSKIDYTQKFPHPTNVSVRATETEIRSWFKGNNIPPHRADAYMRAAKDGQWTRWVV